MAENALFIGKQVGNYRIIAPIASGAYGSVYKAQHITFSNRFVAVKMMHTRFDTEEEQLYFFREAQILERLRHRYGSDNITAMVIRVLELG